MDALKSVFRTKSSDEKSTLFGEKKNFTLYNLANLSSVTSSEKDGIVMLHLYGLIPSTGWIDIPCQSVKEANDHLLGFLEKKADMTNDSYLMIEENGTLEIVDIEKTDL